MHKDIHADLKNTVVESVSINLDPDKMKCGNITLSVEGKSELRIPKEENDLSILLVSSMEIESQEDDVFHASFVVNFFFSVNEKLSDYDEIITKQCLPIIEVETKTLVNKFLSDMGFPGIFKTMSSDEE